MPRMRQAVMVEPSGLVLIPGLDDLLAQRHPLGDSTPYDAHATQRFPLGTILIDLTTSRRFCYALAGAGALAPARLVQSQLVVPNHINQTPAVTAIGATAVSVTFGATAGAINLYKDGFFFVNDGTAVGNAYRVRSHPAIPGAGGVVIITLYDPLVVGLDATSRISMIHNPYSGVIIHPSPPTAGIVGVPLVTIPIANYGWLQTYGPCPILQDGALVVGDHCTPSAAVDGSVKAVAAFTNYTVGRVLNNAGDTKTGLVWLNLDPA